MRVRLPSLLFEGRQGEGLRLSDEICNFLKIFFYFKEMEGIIMIIHQISVFIENKPGRLTEIVSSLSEKGIDIRALSIADTTDFGILRLIVNDPELAMRILKDEGVTVSKTQVIGVRMADRAGALAEVLAILRDAKIAVEYAYAFITHSKSDACVVLRVEDNESAIRALSAHGIAFLEDIQ